MNMKDEITEAEEAEQLAEDVRHILRDTGPLAEDVLLQIAGEIHEMHIAEGMLSLWDEGAVYIAGLSEARKILWGATDEHEVPDYKKPSR